MCDGLFAGGAGRQVSSRGGREATVGAPMIVEYICSRGLLGEERSRSSEQRVAVRPEQSHN